MFLDLRKDQYVSVPQPNMDALIPWISGWKIPRPAQRALGPPPTAAAELAADLLAAGLLRHCARTNRPSASPPSTAEDELTPCEGGTQRVAGVPGKLPILAALLRADYALRRVPILEIVRRTTRLQRPPRPLHQSLQELRRLIVAFRVVRPWYPRDALCLFDSLALLLFLRHCGHNCQWVFGVREDPFAAHCWIQYGPFVLSDKLERVRLYTPIMVA